MRALCFHGLKAEWVSEADLQRAGRLSDRFAVSSPEASEAMTADTDSSPQEEHLQLYEQERRHARTWSVSRHPPLGAFPSDKKLHNFFTKVFTELLAARRDGRKGWNEALATGALATVFLQPGLSGGNLPLVVPLLVYMCKTVQQIYLFANQKATFARTASL